LHSHTETTTSTEKTTEAPAITTTTDVPHVVKISSKIDNEHRVMIESVRMTLKAIHSGVDMRVLRAMIGSQQKQIEELRNLPAITPKPVFKPETAKVNIFTPETTDKFTFTAQTTQKNNFTVQATSKNIVTPPTRPYRGNVRFNYRVSTTKLPQIIDLSNAPRLRNLARAQMPSTTENPEGIETPSDFNASPLFEVADDQNEKFNVAIIDRMYKQPQNFQFTQINSNRKVDG
jgi:hypothetical protein